MLPFADRMRLRARLVSAVRAFFDERGFVECDTPVAVHALAPEPHLEAPATEMRAQDRPQTRFLQTSPELAMKRLLASGLERIYQIAPAFRDNDYTSRHRPEFRILEWYRRGEGIEALMADCEGLLRGLAQVAHGGPRFTYAGQPIDLTGSFTRLSVESVFREAAGFSILDRLEPEALARELGRLGIYHEPSDHWDDLFHRCFLARVEPVLGARREAVFLTDFPAPLAALARLSPTDPRLAERFELYVAGLELANGFGELVDAEEQRRRFERDRAVRSQAGMHDYPLDERFFAALGALPPCAGIACGLDRLLMLLLDATQIDDVAFIPWDEL